ncbi:hypothetical protein SB751_23255 [Cupriavidus sp. SIMBA_020]|uniref:hypothetical protein n=1 Tax=Cupriavidus sp. SIMBA_020 TaxID=3085766 RepID=UPI00397DB830
MADGETDWAKAAVDRMISDVAGQENRHSPPEMRPGVTWWRPDPAELIGSVPPAFYGGGDPIVEMPSAQHNELMSDVTRAELDAKLEAIEARMDARVASIEGKIDAMLTKMDGRDHLYDQKFSSVEDSLKDTRAAISNLKTTTIVTAVGAVLTIVLGVAAFNATVLSNMVASFESGRNTAASLEHTAQEIKTLQDRIDKQTPKP